MIREDFPPLCFYGQAPAAGEAPNDVVDAGRIGLASSMALFKSTPRKPMQLISAPSLLRTIEGVGIKAQGNKSGNAGVRATLGALGVFLVARHPSTGLSPPLVILRLVAQMPYQHFDKLRIVFGGPFL
jgi:hypothetical protein